MVRSFLEFEWMNQSQSEPAGSELATAARDAIATAGGSASAVEERGDYGWEFHVLLDRTSMVVVVQLSDRWLIIVEEIKGILQRIRGQEGDLQVLRACASLHTAFSSNPDIRSMLWYTRYEFDSGSPGGSEPEIV